MEKRPYKYRNETLQIWKGDLQIMEKRHRKYGKEISKVCVHVCMCVCVCLRVCEVYLSDLRFAKYVKRDAYLPKETYKIDHISKETHIGQKRHAK